MGRLIVARSTLAIRFLCRICWRGWNRGGRRLRGRTRGGSAAGLRGSRHLPLRDGQQDCNYWQILQDHGANVPHACARPRSRSLCVPHFAIICPNLGKPVPDSGRIGGPDRIEPMTFPASRDALGVRTLAIGRIGGGNRVRTNLHRRIPHNSPNLGLDWSLPVIRPEWVNECIGDNALIDFG